jgi:type II secretory pathway component GspD/PulD (secretin)
VNAAALVSFSARNVPIRDAFATLARISGKSITVSGEIQDRQLISVVEIKEQPFNEAFMSLVRAAGVDYIARGDNNFTILRANSRSDVKLFSSLESSDIDLSKPLEERFADLTYDNEDVSNILKDVANRYGVDIILTAQPTERVTVKLKKATLNDVLTLVLSGSQFKFTKSGDAYVIYNSSNKNFSLYNDTAFIPLNFLDAAEVIKLLPDELKKLAKSSEKQNALVADGSVEDIRKLKAFIFAVDQPIPQVELDVKLVELSERFGRSINPYQKTFGLGRIGRFAPDLSTSAADDVISSGFNLNLGADEFQIFNA